MLISIQSGSVVADIGPAAGYRMLREAGFEAIDWNLYWGEANVNAGKFSGCVFEKSPEEILAHYAAEIALSFPSRSHDAGEELWIAELDGNLVGSVMLCRTAEETIGQLRLFLVEKAHRCQGIGHALTTVLLERARAVGYKQLILWSASPLHEALSHYEKLGFHTVETVDNHDWSLVSEVVTEIKMVLNLM